MMFSEENRRLSRVFVSFFGDLVMTRFTIMIVALGLVCGVSQVHGGVYPIPLTNGDFEDLDLTTWLSPNDLWMLASGPGFTGDMAPDAVPGWTLDTNWAGGGYYAGLVGANWLYAGSPYFPVIDTQSVTITGGATAGTDFTLAEAADDVTVTFWTGAGALDTSNALEVRIDGVVQTMGGLGGAYGPVGSMAEFTTDPISLSAGAHTLLFVGGATGDTALIDNVSMVGIVPDIVPGDTDGDEDVDAADATTLASFWQQSGLTGGASEGDFNDDGWANDLDATILAANWTGPSAAAVPEPPGLALILGAISILCFYRRR